jgi:hypothetical protein
MAKYTLLELTQAVLRSIKGEEISDIADTTESLAVVGIIKECYYNLISNTDFPELYVMFELTASGDNNLPVKMSIPSTIAAMEWVKYNWDEDDENPNFVPVRYMELKDFIEMQNSLNLTEDNVSSMELTSGVDTITIKFRTDKMPEWYTSFDDNVLIFDSHLATLDTTLVKAKTLCYGLTEGAWTQSNSFTFSIDAQQYDTLLKEAKAMAWQELKSIENAAALRSARKNRIKAEQKKFRANYTKGGYYYTLYPNYGRKR